MIDEGWQKTSPREEKILTLKNFEKESKKIGKKTNKKIKKQR